jgi:hypothetical protein
VLTVGTFAFDLDLGGDPLSADGPRGFVADLAP